MDGWREYFVQHSNMDVIFQGLRLLEITRMNSGEKSVVLIDSDGHF